MASSNANEISATVAESNNQASVTKTLANETGAIELNKSKPAGQQTDSDKENPGCGYIGYIMISFTFVSIVLCVVLGGFLKTNYVVDIEGTPGVEYRAYCSASEGGKKLAPNQTVTKSGYVPDVIDLRGYGVSCYIEKTSLNGVISAKLRKGNSIISYGRADEEGNLTIHSN